MYRRWIVVAAILLSASLIQIPVVLNADLGWLLTANEKILAGQTLGVDLFESNPPLSVYMYMPAAMLARMTGVAPEFVVIVLVIIEIAGALLMIDCAARHAGYETRERDVLAWCFALLFAILPGSVFGQREHIAVVALTPFVAITAIRWRGMDPGPVAILVGLGAGLAMSIKPFFALVMGLPIIVAIVRQRSIRPLLTVEASVAAVTAIAYAAVVAVVFPDYLFTYAPMVADAYLPIRMEFVSLILIPISVIGASVGFVRIAASHNVKAWSEATPWLAASVGGAAAFLVQGKGWPYTAFSLCLLAIAAPLLLYRANTMRTSVVTAGVCVIVLIGIYLSTPAPGFPPLEQRVQALAKHPRLLTITDHIALGHPLVRELHGVWVGSSCAQLLAGGAILREQDPNLSDRVRAKLNNVVAFERRQLLTNLRNGHPDVILVDTYLFSTFRFDWLAWAKSDPEIRAELGHFREVEGVGRVRIFISQSQAGEPAPS
ncbi:hypothetical protein [Bradyrhizobium uaiense]|uniref:Glycosyltransferase RgtA/B/C/D-like domain-containing protein n=1 Tax=Bradyrhizobium uaiense TaxID=2594946 RepID=A0A6P1BVA1_9BRAD|nr:hypothetical protein [Bradyrhizobium uaiense]NEV01621.1 hypothetical protein [Bradyrhizobium uaiense]